MGDNRVWVLEQGVTPEFEEVRSQFSQIAAYVPDEGDGPDEPEIVVSPLQAKMALLQVGLLDDIEALIASMDRATQIAWNEATKFARSSPLLNALAGAMHWPNGERLTDNDIDKLFEAASKIEI